MRDAAAATPAAAEPRRRAPRGEAKTPKPATRQGKKGLVLYFDPDLVHEIRKLALELRIDVQQLALEAFALTFRQHARPLPSGLPPPKT